jgi:hypothetical protein
MQELIDDWRTIVSVDIEQAAIGSPTDCRPNFHQLARTFAGPPSGWLKSELFSL